MDDLRHVPAVRIQWAEETEPPVLSVTDAMVVRRYEQVIDRTRQAADRAMSAGPADRRRVHGPSKPSSGPLEGPSSLLSEFSEISATAPSQAVHGAFDRVEAALRELVGRQVPGLPETSGARELARYALQQGLVPDGFVDTVDGLSVLRELAQQGTTGIEPSSTRAHDYLTLADAALYVIRLGERRRAS